MDGHPSTLVIQPHWTLFQELSEILRVMEFDFSKPISPCTGKAKVCASCEEIGIGLYICLLKFGYLVILVVNHI